MYRYNYLYVYLGENMVASGYIYGNSSMIRYGFFKRLFQLQLCTQLFHDSRIAYRPKH